MITVAGMPPTLSTAEAAELLGTTEDTLHELRRQGTAPVEPLKLGRVYRWPTALVLGAVGLAPERASASADEAEALLIVHPTAAISRNEETA
jgi:predicted DNA-binding transcriptional regulator AlpA